jgi:hypothetical protein
MKNIYFTNKKKSLFALCLIFVIGGNARADSDSAMIRIKELTHKNEIRPATFQIVFGPAGIEETVRIFNQILPEVSFLPDYKTVTDGNSVIVDGTAAINATQDVIRAILGSDKIKSLNLLQDNEPILTAIDLYAKKLNNAIDPNWKWLTVYANVGPPPGTPNAAAGMDPEAINDPKFKKEYLNLIHQNQNNNLTNIQQSRLRLARDEFNWMLVNFTKTQDPATNWTSANVIARFCKDLESKKLLEQQFMKR